MAQAIEHAPGRLFVTCPWLRDDHDYGSHVVKVMRRLRGVRSVTIESSRGAVTIAYDQSLVYPYELINRLNAIGVLQDVIGFPKPPFPPATNLARSGHKRIEPWPGVPLSRTAGPLAIKMLGFFYLGRFAGRTLARILNSGR